ncbi:Oxidoreductase [Thoreauomyces humboldtii]|nr:Oxidoreductase [Thoreauomyces humboldtii]
MTVPEHAPAASNGKDDHKATDHEESSTTNAALDPEQAQEEAYDEETGEINWDCPCLEGMTKPPCGEKFKAAFSCFVYSKEEPKGVDCLEQFREMQTCFRENPDVYGAELDDDDEEDDEDEEDDDERKENGRPSTRSSSEDDRKEDVATEEPKATGKA